MYTLKVPQGGQTEDTKLRHQFDEEVVWTALHCYRGVHISQRQLQWNCRSNGCPEIDTEPRRTFTFDAKHQIVED